MFVKTVFIGILCESEVFEVGNFKIAVNHATKMSDDFARSLDADVLITCHTHRLHLKIIDGVLLINPGSANRPIESEASVALVNISDDRSVVEDIEVELINIRLS